mgnify:FL=1
MRIVLVMNNYSQKLWNQILHQAEQNMEDGKCSLYRNIYIPMKVRQGRYDELTSSEKILFHNGIRDNLWNKDGVHIGDNSNPYKMSRDRITE